MIWRAFLLLLWASTATAQTDTVAPDDVAIKVFLNDANEAPYRQELVLLTIEGTYRRHIAREALVQPALEGFNWMQLGQDYWWETRENGRLVKKFRRRMALYPDEAGTLEIGPFTHELTLIDSGDDWFEHSIQSTPITLQVQPEPELPDGEWWLPVRWLEIEDNWSNPPDQLAPGEGVMRIIRVEAVGVSPDMIPPMPELQSPSGGVFPHPEKRLVDLTPEGPVTVAFWRWTIQPLNGRSAMLEPIELPYFDTQTRTRQVAVITPNRVAFADNGTIADAAPGRPYALRSWLMALTILGTMMGSAALLWGRRKSI